MVKEKKSDLPNYTISFNIPALTMYNDGHLENVEFFLFSIGSIAYTSYLPWTTTNLISSSKIFRNAML